MREMRFFGESKKTNYFLNDKGNFLHQRQDSGDDNEHDGIIKRRYLWRRESWQG